jgi:isoquinoline 1-oxidoreductase
MKFDGSVFEMEPERYELLDGPAYKFDLERRDFFRVLGAGILVLIPGAAEAQESGSAGQRGRNSVPEEVSAWIHIDRDGLVRVFTGKAEVGQNVRTSLSQVVAEELCTPVDRIRLVMADTALTPFDAGTFGSRTTPVMGPQLRLAAATAREALLDLAAEHLKSDRSALHVEAGRVVDSRSKQALSFGELSKGDKLLRTVSREVPTTAPDDWTIAGTSVPKVDGRSFVTGSHMYTVDVARPGMLVARVLRPPAFKAALESLDTSAARALSGVTVVRDGDFAAVAAADEATAAAAIKLLRPAWKTAPSQPSNEHLFQHLRTSPAPNAGRGRGGPAARGSIAEGMAAADHSQRVTYTVAYIAHAPLEPRAAVAEWDGPNLTVWTGTQRPFGVREELCSAFGIPQDRVRVIVPDTGSGYGGKHSGEAAVEAARIARAAGKPVRLVWTREEEFTWAYFRPAGVIEVSGGIRKNGSITAWEFHNYNSGGSALAPVYDFPNQLTEFHPAQSPLRQGSYRGLAATANHFARESFIDELAHAARLDPVAVRLKNLTNPRMRSVIEAAAERFGWKTGESAKGSGTGIAAGFEKGSYLATCVEVEVEKQSRIRLRRVVQAFECGAVVNPEHLKNQVEGCILQGLGGALFEEVDFEDGRILNPRFSGYRVPRFSDVPPIEVVLVDRKDLPSAGAGETPIVGLAPATANAIFRATGSRLRSMPLARKGLNL